MAVRIEPQLNNTENLLAQILQVVLVNNQRVSFLCPSGSGESILVRIRVMITRKRKKLEARGKRPKRFRLRSTVHTETHSGMRYDCVILWQQLDESHILAQELEDILSHG